MRAGRGSNEGTGSNATAAGAPAEQGYQRDLGQGLRVRWSTGADTEQLVNMFANVLRDGEDAPPNHPHGFWVRDMMSGRCPHITAQDFAVVEDTGTGQIVASSCLFANGATYDDLPFALGRVAIVGTEIPYRHRGLQRAIFDLIHARSAARGHLAQGITGIHYFYRLFGYEYAIDLEAARHVYVATLPHLRAAETAPCALRPAVAADIPLLVELYARERAGWQVATAMDAEAWRWMLFDADPAAGNLGTAYMLTADHQAIGYVLVDRMRRGDSLGIWGMAVTREASLVDIAPHALRALGQIADTMPGHPEPAPPLVRLRLEMGPGHALFAALGPYLAPERKYAYAWWMRIPDVPAFIRHIAPALDQRLAASGVFNEYCGTLCIDFYRGGVRLVFEHGRLATAEEWRKPLWEAGQAGFPAG